MSSKGVFYPGTDDTIAYFEYFGDAGFDLGNQQALFEGSGSAELDQDEPVVIQVGLSGLTIYQVNDPERAEAAANAAQTSAQNAAISETNAAASAAAAANSQSNAASSASAAAASESNAAASASAAAGSESRAATSESNAAGSASAAATSESNAAGSASAAASSENKAKDWAEKAENVPVETGQYSAKHHALKAAASASSAASDKTAAQTAANTATTKAGEAGDHAAAAEGSASQAAASEQAAKNYADDAEDSAEVAEQWAEQALINSRATASNTAFDPTTNIPVTNVQSAVEEVDTRVRSLIDTKVTKGRVTGYAETAGPPSNPEPGYQWLDASTGVVFTWYKGHWVEFGPGGATFSDATTLIQYGVSIYHEDGIPAGGYFAERRANAASIHNRLFIEILDADPDSGALVTLRVRDEMVHAPFTVTSDQPLDIPDAIIPVGHGNRVEFIFTPFGTVREVYAAIYGSLA